MLTRHISRGRSGLVFQAYGTRINLSAYFCPQINPRRMATKTPVYHPNVKEGLTIPAYSPGVICDGWLFVSGQTPLYYPTGEVRLGTIEEETHRVMQNIAEILAGAGCSWDSVVKSTVHLSDISDFERYNAVYATYFSGVLPARTTVQSGLAKGIKIKIDVMAKVPQP